MYYKDAEKMAETGRQKARLLKEHPLSYLIYSALAGAYIGLGILLIYSIGGYLLPQDIPGIKIIQGFAFPMALSIVVMAGSELFTGNTLVMCIASIKGTVPWKTTLYSFLVCYGGNLLGSFLIGWCFVQTGLLTGAVGDYFLNAAVQKTLPAAGELFFRGLICNFFVCLAIWSANRASSDAGKLIMIFWCIFGFITIGLEHSVANMTALTIGLLGQASGLTLSGALYNLIWVTLGNLVGGALLIAVPYSLSRKPQD